VGRRVSLKFPAHIRTALQWWSDLCESLDCPALKVTNQNRYDFKGKRVGVIGNGSSAIQIIPRLQQVEGSQLTCFMRSPTWISPPFADHGLQELGLDPTKTECTSLACPSFPSPLPYLLTD
jgi:hypothetical protein